MRQPSTKEGDSLMRIAIVSRAENVSGKEIMTLELGEGLRREGHAIEFVTSFLNDGSYETRLKELGFSVDRMELGSISATLRWDCLSMTTSQMLRLPRLWESYRRFMRKNQPEHVIHTSWHHLLLLLPLLTSSRDWYWVHEILPDKAHYVWTFGWLSKRLHGFVAVSNAVRDSLLRLGIPENKIHVIHNGIKDIAPAALPLPRNTGAIRIGIVGQVEEWKGHHSLLEAFAKIAHSHPKAEVHVFGSGSPLYTARLKQQAAGLNIAERVFWHGFVTDRSLIFSNFDICAVPSCFEEPFGLIAIEAALFSLPVVAFNRGGLPEIIQDGITGFLIEAGNHNALAAKLSDLLDDAELRRRFGTTARSHVLNHFSNKKFVSDFIQVMQPLENKTPE
jgi:glycosyltransferase involved in cell wall biosynthesis